MNRSTYRLIDANFNRAREALRVCEDYARFVLNDAHISLSAKELRHNLSSCIAQLPSLKLLAARDTPADVGTQLSTNAELTRQNPLAVAAAAAKRLAEALRCLEEYTKIDKPNLSKDLESLRYRAYDLEKRLLAPFDLKIRLQKVRLYVILTEKYCKLPLLEVAKQVLAGGADCIQLREKDKSDAALLYLAQEVSRLCRDADALFIMNDRPDLAVLCDADGVHLGQEDISVAQARKILSPNMLVGKSTHRLDEAASALAESPDYLAVGSIFASPTKPHVKQAGLGLIRQIRSDYTGPLIAIGGINAENAAEAIAAGADGVAVCQSIIAADHPDSAAENLKRILSDLIRQAPMEPD